uniref:Plexin-B2-like isoform X2 n=1 Tax=Crassostrea virginica TaxID=6565 RepID=A0A8B8AYM1_CRAVI|nr:plexin-B2-like isoform X2 [Crassostrea virginica]
MVITNDNLITCSTLKGGLCEKRSKETLNTEMQSGKIRLVSNEKSQAVGIFLNVSDSGQQNIILFAKQYTKLPLPLVKLEESVILSVSPELSTKILEQSDFGKNFDLFLRKDTTRPTMDYRVVMENENFVFLLVNQIQIQTCENLQNHDSSSSNKAYEDIPIICNKDGENLTHVEHGTFVTVSGEKLLVVLFSDLTTMQSSVCVFKESEIYEAFLESRRHRFGCPKHDVTDSIFEGDVNLQGACVSFPFNKSNELIPGLFDAFYKGDFCNNIASTVFGVIVGLLPLIGQAVYTSPSHRGTVVGSTVINDLVTLHIGTSNGYVIQVFYDPDKKETIELREMKVDRKSQIRAIKTVNNRTYIMSQNKIVRMLQQKNCGQFSSNCQQCISARDANCGWCVVNNKCTTKSQCSNNEEGYWLPSVKNKCLSLEIKGYPLGFGYKLDGDSSSRGEKTLTIQFVPQIPYTSEMGCRLNGSSVAVFAKSVSGGIECTIPSATGGRGTSIETPSFEEGNVDLQIVWGATVIAGIPILFYNCSKFQSCGECLKMTNKTDCYWCELDVTCRAKRGDCTNDTAIYNPPYDENCPQINSTQKLKIPSGQQRTLEFEGKNLPQSNVNIEFNYECVVDSDNFPGRKIGSMIECANMMIGGEGYKTVQFKYGRKDKIVRLETFGGNVLVEVYRCESLSSSEDDCSTCHYYNQSEGYECHWCKNTGCIVIDDSSVRAEKPVGGRSSPR